MVFNKFLSDPTAVSRPDALGSKSRAANSTSPAMSRPGTAGKPTRGTRITRMDLVGFLANAHPLDISARLDLCRLDVGLDHPIVAVIAAEQDGEAIRLGVLENDKRLFA